MKRSDDVLHFFFWSGYQQRLRKGLIAIGFGVLTILPYLYFKLWMYVALCSLAPLYFAYRAWRDFYLGKQEVWIDLQSGKISLADNDAEVYFLPDFQGVFSRIQTKSLRSGKTKINWVSVWLRAKQFDLELGRFIAPQHVLIAEGGDHPQARELRAVLAERFALRNLGIQGKTLAEQMEVHRKNNEVAISDFAIPLGPNSWAWLGLSFLAGAVLYLMRVGADFSLLGVIAMGLLGFTILGFMPLMVVLLVFNGEKRKANGE